MVFSKFRRSPLWPRQRGSVKAYNEAFDDNVTRSQLQFYLLEEHLVEAYVGGLKDEIRDSIEFFQPRTIGGARAYAQIEEWDLQKKAEEARRLAKVQVLGFRDDVQPWIRVAQNRAVTRELSCLRQTGTLAEFNAKFDSISANLDVSEDYLVKTYVCGLKEEVAETVYMANPLTLLSAKRLARLQEVSLQWLARKAEKVRKELENPEKACSTNTQEGPVEHTAADKVHEADEGLKSSFLEEETESEVAVGIMEDATEETRNAGLPSSPLPSSPEVMVQETLSLVAAVPSPLSLQVESESCDLAVKTNAGVVWQLLIISEPKCLGLTSSGMNKTEFEKSNQLAPIFTKCQRYFANACEFFMVKGQMGFHCGSKGKGPRFHSWINFKWPPFVQICPIPTLCLIQFWFRGKLIKMLAGSALHQLFLFGSEFSKCVVPPVCNMQQLFKTDFKQQFVKDQQSFFRIRSL